MVKTVHKHAVNVEIMKLVKLLTGIVQNVWTDIQRLTGHVKHVSMRIYD